MVSEATNSNELVLCGTDLGLHFLGNSSYELELFDDFGNCT